MKNMALLFIGSLLLSTPSPSAFANGIPLPTAHRVGEQAEGKKLSEPDLSDVSPRGARQPEPQKLEIRFHRVTRNGKTKYFVDEVDPQGPFAKRYIPGREYDELPTPPVRTRGLAADAKSDPENSTRAPSH